jgi:hypothetical protein
MKSIKMGKQHMLREEITDVDSLMNHDGFRRMVTRHLETLREHCFNYPKMDKARKVNIVLSLTPIWNESTESYDKATFSASVKSPVLPETSVDFNCSVVNGQPFFNVEDPSNPMQLSFRDIQENDDESVPDRKSLAVKD